MYVWLEANRKSPAAFAQKTENASSVRYVPKSLLLVNMAATQLMPSTTLSLTNLPSLQPFGRSSSTRCKKAAAHVTALV